MGDKSRIEWTDATWNPVVGCEKVSPGCDNCYAIAMSRRIEATGNETYQGITTEDDWTGLVKCLPERLDQPLRWRRPRRVFVNSMSDLFHPDVPDGFILDVWRIMGEAWLHQFQILTKRPQRMASWVNRWADRTGEDLAGFKNARGPEEVRQRHLSPSGQLFAAMLEGWGRPPEGAAYPTFDWMEGMLRWPDVLWNVWLGTSIESDRYTFRANHLRETPAAVRFLSLEPLLGPLPSLDLDGIDWVIVGGESGPNHRPIDPDWVRDIRDRCVAAGVPFFFKQWGGRTPKSGGRELDGQTWDQYPAEIAT